MRYHLTLKSSNAKTGKIPVSTSARETCPPECPLLGDCYGSSGYHLRMHWDKVSKGERGVEWGEFLEQIRAIPEGSLWRHNQVGDLPGEGSKIDARKLGELTLANRGKRGWTYTHKPVLSGEHAQSNQEAIRKANKGGFTVNLSANNPQHADELAKLGIAPVCVILPRDAERGSRTPEGRRIVTCPAQVREDTDCSRCGLCAKAERKGVIVGFLAHGANARKVEQLTGNV
jgi:hypothetical protein